MPTATITRSARATSIQARSSRAGYGSTGRRSAGVEPAEPMTLATATREGTPPRRIAFPTVRELRPHRHELHDRFHHRPANGGWIVERPAS